MSRDIGPDVEGLQSNTQSLSEFAPESHKLDIWKNSDELGINTLQTGQTLSRTMLY